LSFLYFLTCTTTGFNALIRLSSLFLSQSITAEGTEGRLLDELSIAELNYQYESTHIKIKNIHLKWKLSSLLHHELPIELLQADSVVVKQDDTLLAFNHFRLSALYTNQILTLNSLNFDYLDFKISGGLQLKTQLPYTFSSTIKFHSLNKTKIYSAGVLSAAGDINLINWTGNFHGLGKVSLQGSLGQLYQLEQIITWRDLNWPNSPDPIHSKEGRIKISGALPNLNIELSSKLNRAEKEQWQINGAVNGTLPWSWNFNLNVNQPYYGGTKKQGIYTGVSFIGSLKNHKKGQLTIKIAPGHYQMPQDSKIASLAFQGGVIKTFLSSKGLKGEGTLAMDEYKKFKIKFNLPDFDLAAGVTHKQTFSSNVSLAINSFDFLPSLIPEIKNPKGTLVISLAAKGTFDKPNIETKMTLKNASVELPNLGINLHSIDSTVIGKKDHWEGAASINSGTQALIIKGQGLLAPQLTSEITLESSNFPIINTDDYQIKISPKLHLNYKPDVLQIAGSVLVPYAQIKIQSFSNSLSLSNDVVFESQNNSYSSPIRSKIDLQVEMGDHVELSAKGLHATLIGRVNISQSSQSAMNATGELNVAKGEYKAYGQSLSIEQGELFFTGGAIDNPGINLRASKKVNASSSSATGTNQLLDFNSNNIQNANLRGNIKVGVEVTGRLTDPKVQLFSTPAILSQADILSMIVLGRPASQINKAGGQLILAALSSMNLGGNTNGMQLLGQLKESLGIDFNVETNSNYNLLNNTVSDKTAFVVSKSLSKRISLSYNVGLSQADPNVVTLKYLLNQFFSIQVNSSGSSSGIDVLYTSSKK
jgi:translocation and assembly module TamB